MFFGFNEIVFFNNWIIFVDLLVFKDDGDSVLVVGIIIIIGIVVGVVVLFLVGGGFVFVCFCKRKNKIRCVSVEVDFYSNFGVGGYGYCFKLFIFF